MVKFIESELILLKKEIDESSGGMMADNHYVSCIAASYISFTNRPVKTGCVKTKLSAISSLGLG